MEAFDREQSYVYRANAYVFAFLMFFAMLVGAEARLLRMWFTKRAAIRSRSILMSSIYDKALKRRDLSGSTDSQSEKEGHNSVGADVGKITNLMSGDAMEVRRMC
jgi:hypothetical protein